jgi:hypothetical protein
LQCDAGIGNSLCPSAPAAALALHEVPDQFAFAPALQRSRSETMDVPAGSARAASAGSLDGAAPRLVVGSSILDKDGEASIPITLSLGEGQVAAATIELRFDPRLLQALECQLGEGIKGACNPRFDADGKGEDALRFSLVMPEGMAGEKVLARLRFSDREGLGLPGAPSQASLKPLARILDAQGREIAIDVMPGILGKESIEPGAGLGWPTFLPFATVRR